MSKPFRILQTLHAFSPLAIVPSKAAQLLHQGVVSNAHKLSMTTFLTN